MPWDTMWNIAHGRDTTKRGKDHLSKSGYAVLEYFYQTEVAEAVAEQLVRRMLPWLSRGG